MSNGDRLMRNLERKILACRASLDLGKRFWPDDYRAVVLNVATEMGVAIRPFGPANRQADAARIVRRSINADVGARAHLPWEQMSSEETWNVIVQKVLHRLEELPRST